MSEDKRRSGIVVFIDTHKYLVTILSIISFYMIIELVLVILEGWGLKTEFFRQIKNPLDKIIQMVMKEITPERILMFLIMLTIMSTLVYIVHPGEKFFFAWVFNPENYELTPLIIPYRVKYGQNYVEGKPLISYGDQKFSTTTATGTLFHLVDWFLYDKKKDVYAMEYEESYALTAREWIANIKLIRVHAEMEASMTLENLFWRGAASREVADQFARYFELIKVDKWPDLAIQPEVLHNLKPLLDRINKYLEKPEKPVIEELDDSGTEEEEDSEERKRKVPSEES